MRKPIREYSSKRYISGFRYFLAIFFIVTYFWLGFIMDYSKIISIIGKILFFVSLINLGMVCLFDFCQRTRRGKVCIYENKVIIIFPFLNNFRVTLTKKEVDSVFIKKIYGTDMAIIKLKNREEFAKKWAFVNPPYSFTYALVHYIIYKTNKIQIRFEQLRFKSLSDSIFVNRTNLRLNEKKMGGHLFFPKNSYPEFDNLFKDLNKALSA